MHVNLDPRDALYVARQPILDSADRIFGYELLYRDTAQATACTNGGDMVAARVLADAVLGLGLEMLTAGRPAFINVTKQLLVGSVSDVLSASATIIEVCEQVEVDADVIEACRGLHARGHALALDDFVPGTSAEHLLPYAKFVKVDVLATSAEMRAELARRLLPRGLQLIAEKVETSAMAADVRAEGYAFVQGYYFCKPSTLSAKVISGRRLAYLQLLAAVNRPAVTVSELEELIKHDASMSLRVLRCINSAAFGLRREIQSIRQAIILLGLDQIKKWASIWALAGVNQGGTTELTTVAILRARCCELLGASLTGESSTDGFFLLGLCSVLEAMVAQPMERTFEELPVGAETRDALLGHPGVRRSILDAVIAYENGRWSKAEELLSNAGLEGTLMPAAYTEALRWARQLSQEAQAA